MIHQFQNDSNSGFNLKKNSITLPLNSSFVGFLIPLILNHTIAQLPPATCGKRSNARSISIVGLLSFLILEIWRN